MWEVPEMSVDSILAYGDALGATPVTLMAREPII